MSRHFKFSLLMVVLASVVYLAGLNQASASSLLFDRGLPVWNGNTPPTSNLNGYNPVPLSRSNFAPLPPGQPYPVNSPPPTSYQVSGDTFSLGSQGQTYHIDLLRVWMIFGTADSQYDHLNPHMPAINMALWAGDAHGVEKVETAYTATRVYYSDGSNFQRTSSDGAWRQIWQIDFAATGDNRIEGGQSNQFFLDGMFLNTGGQWQVPSLHLENSSLSNNRADGADGSYLLLTLNNGVAGDVTSFGSPGHLDANVQIYGEQVVPLPGTLLLLGSGLLGLVGVGRRFRKD